MYKMHTNTVPQNLYDTIADFRNNIHVQYNTRNEEKYLVPTCKLDIFKKSFIPDAICKWNDQPNDVFKSSTLGQFRRSMSNYSKDSSAPMFFQF